MGKPLMIQPDDHRRIERLKTRLGLATKIGVIRAGLQLLEADADRAARAVQWRRAAGRVADVSRKVNAEFRKHSRFRRS
jgi:hypothetical protein